MTDETRLVQTRVPPAQYKKLVKAQKEAGFFSMSEYLRFIIATHLSALKGGEK